MIKNSYAAIDFETHAKELDQDKIPVCMSYKTPTHQGVVAGKKDIARCLLYLYNNFDMIVAHNLSFELTIIMIHMQEYPDVIQKTKEQIEKIGFDDTAVCARYWFMKNNIDPDEHRKSHTSLANLGKRFLGKDRSAEKKGEDVWRLNYHKLDGVAIEQYPQSAYDYCLQDSLDTYELYGILDHPSPLTSLSAAICNYFTTVEGILIDQDRVQQVENYLSDTVEESKKIMIEYGYAKVTKKGEFKRERKKFTEMLEEKYPDTIMRSEKGNISTNKEARQYWDTKDVLLNAWNTYDEYSKFITAYVPKFKNGTLYTTYNPCVNTGRMSCYAGYHKNGVNIQQLPKGIPGLEFK